MKNKLGTIKEIKELTDTVFSTKISFDEDIRIHPGEYISVLCKELTLRRPFSIADFSDNTITILIKKRGKGTQYLSSLKANDTVEVSLPLGNGFKIDNKRTLLIGAGIGVAPLFYLKKELEKAGAKTYLAAGFTTKKEILGSIDFISTDDGTNENKGSICDYIERLIKDFNPEKIVSCAPLPVLKAVAQIAKAQNIECEVCMEKVMACGIGVCRGCVIKVIKDGKIQNATVCKDGPVFNAEEVIW